MASLWSHLQTHRNAFGEQKACSQLPVNCTAILHWAHLIHFLNQLDCLRSNDLFNIVRSEKLTSHHLQSPWHLSRTSAVWTANPCRQCGLSSQLGPGVWRSEKSGVFKCAQTLLAFNIKIMQQKEFDFDALLILRDIIWNPRQMLYRVWYWPPRPAVVQSIRSKLREFQIKILWTKQRKKKNTNQHETNSKRHVKSQQKKNVCF